MTSSDSKIQNTTNCFGESQPMHDNSTAADRAKNRRVNVVILPDQKMIDDAKNQAGDNYFNK